jgi:hypothetical protein
MHVRVYINKYIYVHLYIYIYKYCREKRAGPLIKLSFSAVAKRVMTAPRLG